MDLTIILDTKVKGCMRVENRVGAGSVFHSPQRSPRDKLVAIARNL